MNRAARLWPVIALGGLVLVAMLAAGLQGRPTPNGSGVMPEPAPTFSASPPPTSGLVPAEQGEPNPFVQLIANIILVGLLALLALALLALLAVAARALVRAWRARPLRRAGGDDVGEVHAAHALADPEDPVDTRSVQRGIAAALRDVDERPRPADAIVAAWLGLEQSAADAGAARGKSETPGEFALRVITLRDGLSRDARTLLGLYQRVRFGEHDADEADRAAARRALQHIEEGWR